METKEIKFTLPQTAFKSFAAKLGISLLRPSNGEEKVLAYFLNHSINGQYYCATNSRQILLSYLNMTDGQYRQCVKKLKEYGAITPLKNAKGNTFIFYEIAPKIIEIWNS